MARPPGRKATTLRYLRLNGNVQVNGFAVYELSRACRIDIILKSVQVVGEAPRGALVRERERRGA